MVPRNVLDVLARLLPKGKGSAYRISSQTLRGYNKARAATTGVTLKHSTLTDDDGRQVAAWLLEKIAKSYKGKFDFDKGWQNLSWVSLVLLGYWVGWATGGVGTLLRNMRKKSQPLTLANALVESRKASVRKAAKDPKNYVIALRLAKAVVDEDLPMPALESIPKAPKRAGFGLGIGLALGALLLFAASKGKN